MPLLSSIKSDIQTLSPCSLSGSVLIRCFKKIFSVQAVIAAILMKVSFCSSQMKEGEGLSDVRMHSDFKQEKWWRKQVNKSRPEATSQQVGVYLTLRALCRLKNPFPNGAAKQQMCHLQLGNWGNRCHRWHLIILYPSNILQIILRLPSAVLAPKSKSTQHKTKGLSSYFP